MTGAPWTEPAKPTNEGIIIIWSNLCDLQMLRTKSISGVYSN
jgi:hypothetical protein